MENKRIIRIIISVIFISVIAIIPYMVSRADMGPKPSITLTVENAPDEYYIALLNYLERDKKENSPLYVSDYDADVVKEYLDNFYYEGWDLFDWHGFKNADPEHRYTFTYMVPDPFRVLIITADGIVHISDKMDQHEYWCDCYYDFETGRITENIVDTTWQRVYKIALGYIFTLISEGFVLFIFGYPFIKENILSFIKINTITQIGLNIISFNSIGFIFLFCFVISEFVIILVEAVYYTNRLKSKNNELRKAKNFIYGVAANLFSVGLEIVIFFLSGFTFRVLVKG